ncbi:hypothetical protein Tco_1516440, partial [Tanacetum coccineum]
RQRRQRKQRKQREAKLKAKESKKAKEAKKAMEVGLKAKEEKKAKEAKKALEAEMKAKKDKKAKEAEVISISIRFKASTAPTPTRSNFPLLTLPQDPELPLHPLPITSCFYCSKRVQENSYDMMCTCFVCS